MALTADQLFLANLGMDDGIFDTGITGVRTGATRNAYLKTLTDEQVLTALTPYLIRKTSETVSIAKHQAAISTNIAALVTRLQGISLTHSS